MIGIDVENLSKLIKINNLNVDDVKNDVENLIDILNELEVCYAGSSIEFAFSNLINQSGNLKKVSEVIQNYSDTLSSVKTSYVSQEANFSDQFNHINIQ